MALDHQFFASMTCGSPVTWDANIKQMFTATDVAHMKTKGIDLSDYQTVMINAVQIYGRVSDGSMPPPGSGEQPWSQAWVTTFGCWIQQNCPES